jgi:predicted protein tyrosine phosphatase
MSMKKASELIPDERTALISVREPDEDPTELAAFPYSQWTHKLIVQCDDAESTFYDVFTMRDIIPMTSEQAQQIVKYITAIADKIDTLVIHCHAGISRSSAVAKWAAEKYGLYFPDKYCLYNKHIYKILQEVENDVK